jgi:hypothetical protein
VWCEKEICEERGTNGIVARRAFGLGEQVNGSGQFFTANHQGSITEVSNSAGTVVAGFTFEPWGRRTLVSGTDLTQTGFTGHSWQADGEVWLTLYRAYDISRVRPKLWTVDQPGSGWARCRPESVRIRQ